MIFITGGTGTLGKLVTPRLRDAGHDVRVLTRRPRPAEPHLDYVVGDLTKDTPDLTGADVVVHLAGGAKGDEVATANLVRAAQQAGVRHIVYISVIAADRLPIGYFRQKADSERIIAESGIPWTTVRAAQFHDFVLNVARFLAKLPVVPVPGGLRFQPVDKRDVADRIVELALGAPAGLVPDLAGPKVYGMGELLRDYLAATGKRRPTIPLRIPGKIGRAYRAGDNLTLTGATLGTRTWEDYLREPATTAKH
ncbi:MAG: NAD(P)H-binding protein [Nonomuraea sp.]|nr:NAD(P)H-binding protein [Nonomuraea sp.]